MEGQSLFSFGSEGSDEGQMRSPSNIAISHPPTGKSEVFVLDTWNHRVQVFDVDGKFIRSWGSEGSGSGQLLRPKWLEVVGEEVLVVDAGNHRIQVFDRSGKLLRGWGSHGSETGQFDNPRGIAVSANADGAVEKVFISDESNSRVQVFDSVGTYLYQWYLTTRSCPGSDQRCPPNERIYPKCLCILPSASASCIWVTTGDMAAHIFTLTGQYLARFTEEDRNEGPDHALDPGPDKDGVLSLPLQMAVAKGELYVVDYNNHRIQVFEWPALQIASITSA